MVTERYVDTRSAFEWGLVCHALAGAMREILEDWHLLVTQLEHKQLQGKLDLQVRDARGIRESTLTEHLWFSICESIDKIEDVE